jgi:DNA-binding HxlR family transcriptional regulator
MSNSDNLRNHRKKRTVLVIKEMFRGITQFNLFLEKIEGITSKGSH